MDEKRMDSVLGSLSAHTPKAPDHIVEKMVRTVNELNRLRGRQTERTAGAAGRRTQVLSGEAGFRKLDKHKKSL